MEQERRDMSRPKILVVDDDANVRFVIREVLQDKRFYIDEACNGKEALKKVSQVPYDLAIVDLVMPEKDGFDFLEEVRSIQPDLVTVVITAYGSQKTAVEAMKAGAYDYFSKPFDNDELRIVVKRVLEKRRLEQKIKLLQNQLAQREIQFGEIVGSSDEMQEVFSLIRRIGDSEVNVLIYGESGTGKELVAHALHKESARAEQPLVKVNCAAIPETLLESELFGYERGAFTGAYTRKPGKFEMANGGTIFLDEIGDMPLSIQAKLLRVIEQREFERLGSTETITADIRIIAATNKDLLEATRNGTFREDLYFRINVMPVYLPPLRVRKGDIPLLVEHFINVYNSRLYKNIKGVARDVMENFMNYPWNGNVRELQNVIQRAMIMAKSDFITADCLPPGYMTTGECTVGIDPMLLEDFGTPLGDKIQHVTDRLEKMLIERALQKTNYHRQNAAELLGISRKSLHNKMVKYRLFE